REGSVELRAWLRILERAAIAGNGGPEHAPDDAVTGLIQTREGRLQPLRLGQFVAARNPAVVEDQLGRHGGPHGKLVMDLAGFESFGGLLDEEAADPLLAAGPDDGQVGDIAVRDPALGAVENPVRAVATRPRRHPSRIGTELGFGQTEAPDHLTGRHPRQPALLLLLRPIAMD